MKSLDRLISYVIGLLHEDGFYAVHTSQLIPHYQLGVDKGWTQFPKLSKDQLERLAAFQVTYDQPSGWFRAAK